MDNLKRLGNQFSISIPRDKDGYVGRECPIEKCLGYFKITPGTGVTEPSPCHCPYCGHAGEQNTFFTQEQINYARSVAIQKITGAVRKDFKSLEFDHRPRGAFGIGISMKLQDAPLPLIQHYREKELETEVLCSQCTLRYAIYGVFGWCPDCGVHNSLQILWKNLEVARKKLTLAKSLDMDLANHLIGDALENVVATFDGFGREICAHKGQDIRFQNLAGAKHKVESLFHFDFTDVLIPSEWDDTVKAYQKRHLLAHKLGVVDEDYLQRTHDSTAILGRKIKIESEEVIALASIVERLGQRLYNGVLTP